MESVTYQQIADALGVKKNSIIQRAKRQKWPYSEIETNGGKQRLFAIADLPHSVATAVLSKMPAQSATETPVKILSNEIKTAAQNAEFTYNRDELWRSIEGLPESSRRVGEAHARLLSQVVRMTRLGMTFRNAAETVLLGSDIPYNTLRGWYYGNSRRAGARHYAEVDWPAVLTPRYTGRTATADCDPYLWDFYVGHYLNQGKHSFADAYRRTEEIAKKRGLHLPNERTLRRRLERENPKIVQVRRRHGNEAASKLYPSLTRDKSCFAAGEAVSGDGLKFDKLWVDWGDEIINTTTAWVWQDIRSNKLLAHRIAKTENTDVFRLATYDLTAITLPKYVQVDNTRVAANKAMTGQAAGRHRFHNKDSDGMGLLLQLGMEVHFTDPDHSLSNPGAKPVERSFGIGGLHSEVVSNPRLMGKGYSKATAIPIDLFRDVVAEEIARFNARTKRRTAICRGILSFDEAFAESYSQSTVRKATDAQRRLLLMMQEKVRASSVNGEITLKAGASTLGKNRYWHERLTEYLGQDLIAYYDPDNLEADIYVYSLQGKLITQAQHRPTVAFNDTATAREHRKNKKRFNKATRLAADAATRMSHLERAAMYPKTEGVEIPDPGVVQGHFSQRKQVQNGALTDRGDDDLEAMRDEGDNLIERMWANRAKPIL